MTSPSVPQSDLAIARELSSLIDTLASVSDSRHVDPYRDFIRKNQEQLLSLLGNDGWALLRELADTAIHPTACIVQARDARQRVEKAKKHHDWAAEKEANEMAEWKDKSREQCAEANRKRRSDAQELLAHFRNRYEE